ncbi:MAG: hypothetical protein E7317_01350 [Clostridiales bacterium]|nr:hypothetical protein [Clostridiales bacterium]
MSIQRQDHADHILLKDLPYTADVRRFLAARYAPDRAAAIWKDIERQYGVWLADLPDYGGRRNGHARAIYGGLLVFALYVSLPDRPPIGELQDFVQNMFMGSFTKLGKVFDLNRPADMWLIDKVFRRSGDRDRRDIRKWPAGFVNVDAPYDRRHRAARYCFTQCPNAVFAKEHGLLHVLPLLCNSDFFGIGQLHGQLIRQSTCGNGDVCDYLVVGSENPIAREYETVTDGRGFLVSRRRPSGKEGASS